MSQGDAGEARHRDAKLVKALLRGGDAGERAARDIFEMHYGKLIEGLVRSGVDVEEADAEEVAVEAIMRLFEAPHTFDACRASLGTYLSAVARNLARDRHRRSRRLQLVPLTEQSVLASNSALLVGESVRDRLVELVRRELRDLTPAVRRAAELRLSGLEIADIAAELGCRPATVRTRLCRARAELRARFGAPRRSQELQRLLK